MPAALQEPLSGASSTWSAGGILLGVALLVAVIPVERFELFTAFLGAAVWMCIHISKTGFPRRLKGGALREEPPACGGGAAAQGAEPPEGNVQAQEVAGAIDVAPEPSPAQAQLSRCVETWARRRNVFLGEGDGTAGNLPPAAWRALEAHWLGQRGAAWDQPGGFELEDGYGLFAAWVAYYTEFDWHGEAAQILLEQVGADYSTSQKHASRPSPAAGNASLLGSAAPRLTANGAERLLREFRSTACLLDSGFAPEELLAGRRASSAGSTGSASGSCGGLWQPPPRPPPSRSLRGERMRRRPAPPARSIIAPSRGARDEEEEEEAQPAEQDGDANGGAFAALGAGRPVVLSLKTYATLWLITPQGGIL